MASERNVLIDPCGVARPPRYKLAERRETPNGGVLGLLDNGKTNVGLILKKVGEIAAGQLGFSRVVHFRKPGVAHPCPEKMLDEIKSQCAAVVNGIGD